MSSYVVLARKWRPSQFADVVGQSHIVRTLSNAIRSNRVHHAYLFTGSRGIGKTSIARIFAKVLRCANPIIPEGDAAPVVSCDQCSACLEMIHGSGVDVLEIDGASNNGVDAVREIRDNSNYMPATGGKKIYIIDEVHMLTTAAFNALLKTLEEPPPHVLFILATTEPHKIPATITSRCQPFNFKRVNVSVMQARLKEIVAAEGIEAEPAALTLVARAAEGSMRDSLSLLDQVIAYSGQRVTAEAVRDSVGLIETQTLIAILRGVFDRQAAAALQSADAAYQAGHDLRVLTRGLIELLHSVVLAQVGSANPATLEYSSEEWEHIQELARLRTVEEAELIFQVLHYGLEWIAKSPQPKCVLDILLVKCACAEELVPVRAATPVATLSPETAVRSSSASSTTQAPPANLSGPTVTAVARPAATATPTWEGFIEVVRQSRPLLASLLEHGVCEQLEPEWRVSFRPEGAYYRDQLQSRAYQEQIMQLASQYFGSTRKMTTTLSAVGAASAMGESLAAKKERVLREQELSAQAAVENHPIIKEARALFGGEMSRIEIVTERAGHA